MPKIACLVGPCSARKSAAPEPALCLASGSGTLESRQAEWICTLRQSEGLTPAHALYRGRAVRALIDWGRNHDTPVAIISAGLGLIAGHTRIPPYEATVSDLARGARSPWWAYLQRESPFATPWSALLDRAGLLLIALTSSYADLVVEDLARMDAATLARVRLFGGQHLHGLPESLRQYVMPYDGRLDRVRAGGAGEYAVRALLHFAEGLTAGACPGDLEAQRAWVNDALGESVGREQRPRVDDDVLRVLVTDAALDRLSIRAGIRRLRDQHAVACEMDRFKRIRSEVSAWRVQNR